MPDQKIIDVALLLPTHPGDEISHDIARPLASIENRVLVNDAAALIFPAWKILSAEQRRHNDHATPIRDRNGVVAVLLGTSVVTVKDKEQRRVGAFRAIGEDGERGDYPP